MYDDNNVEAIKNKVPLIPRRKLLHKQSKSSAVLKLSGEQKKTETYAQLRAEVESRIFLEKDYKFPKLPLLLKFPTIESIFINTIL